MCNEKLQNEIVSKVEFCKDKEQLDKVYKK